MGLRGLVRKLVWACGLQGLVLHVRELRIAATAGAPTISDRKPLPPPLMRVRAFGAAHPDDFLLSGRATVAELNRLLDQANAPLRPASRVLDLGCGPGRLARWIKTPAAVTGVDIDPGPIAWCAANLAGDWRVSTLGAPLPAGDAAFDLVLAYDLLSHLRQSTAHALLAEVARVLAPGGVAVVSFNDARHPLAGPVAATLAQSGFALRFDALEGSNLPAAFYGADRLAQMAAPGLVAAFSLPSDQTVCGQALAVLRRAP